MSKRSLKIGLWFVTICCMLVILAYHDRLNPRRIFNTSHYTFNYITQDSTNGTRLNNCQNEQIELTIESQPLAVVCSPNGNFETYNQRWGWSGDAQYTGYNVTNEYNQRQNIYGKHIESTIVDNSGKYVLTGVYGNVLLWGFHQLDYISLYWVVIIAYCVFFLLTMFFTKHLYLYGSLAVILLAFYYGGNFKFIHIAFLPYLVLLVMYRYSAKSNLQELMLGLAVMGWQIYITPFVSLFTITMLVTAVVFAKTNILGFYSNPSDEDVSSSKKKKNPSRFYKIWSREIRNKLLIKMLLFSVGIICLLLHIFYLKRGFPPNMSYSLPTPHVSIFAISPDANLIANATNSNIRVWDRASGEVLADLTAPSDYIISIQFDSMNRHLLAWDSSDVVYIWEIIPD